MSDHILPLEKIILNVATTIKSGTAPSINKPISESTELSLPPLKIILADFEQKVNM